jgi:hypothetical protein
MSEKLPMPFSMNDAVTVLTQARFIMSEMARSRMMTPDEEAFFAPLFFALHEASTSAKSRFPFVAGRAVQIELIAGSTDQTQEPVVEIDFISDDPQTDSPIEHDQPAEHVAADPNIGIAA